MITETELDAIEARANAATPGPWDEPGFSALDAYDARSMVHAHEDAPRFSVLDACDARFVAHARTDVPRLIAEVRRLQSENARQALLLDEASATVRCDECGEPASLILVKQCFYCDPPEE